MTMSCASHALSMTECSYPTVEKKALGCMWAVKKFDKYLLCLPCCKFELMDVLLVSRINGNAAMGNYIRDNNRKDAADGSAQGTVNIPRKQKGARPVEEINHGHFLYKNGHEPM